MQDQEIFNSYFNDLKKVASAISPIPDSEWDFYREQFGLRRYKKGDLLLSPGDPADWFFYVGKGLVKRYFICHDGRQYITSFDQEGRVASDFVSFVKERPATLFIEALEDTDILASKNQRDVFFDRHQAWERNGRRIAELRYVEKSEREYEFLHYDAAGRLKLFLENQPDLKERISQKDLAHYIGVTPESLNRLLSKHK